MPDSYDINSYEGLKDAVQDYLGRDDLTRRIPMFIALAEKRLNRELRLRLMERRGCARVEPGISGSPLPCHREPGAWDVFLEMRDAAFAAGGNITNLAYVPPDDYQRQSADVGFPRRYTIIGSRLFLSPTPDAAGELRLVYYAEIPPLSDEFPENKLIRRYPDIYLYAALMESIPFTRGSAPGELWTQYYQEARDRLMENERRGRFTANLRMRPERRV